MTEHVFTLEALRARHGDCLILHYGRAEKPRRILIDGGASGVYRKYLKPRLEALRGDQDLLRFEMLMVSHIDDDHIRGVLDLTDALCELAEDHRPMPYRFKTLWHNSFDDIVGNEPEVLRQASVASVGGEQALAASVDGAVPSEAEGWTRDGCAIAASVPQGRKLRRQCDALGMSFNRRPGHFASGPQQGIDALITAEADAEPLDMGSGLTFRVLGPLRHRVETLQTRWDKELERRGLAQDPEPIQAADYVDGSVFNLASLVLWAELDGKSMLLTGDARGDDILEGAALAGLLDDAGEMHVDLLKMPHHGSDRNVASEFFRRIRADHYLFSGNGFHGNPELETFRLLFEARQPDGQPFNIHLTYGLDELSSHYPVDELRAFLGQAHQDGHAFELVFPDPDAAYVDIALL